jgi:hypothetical protein
VNLGWKLAQVVQGRAPAALLDSYHAERHPVGARVIATVLAQLVLRDRPDARHKALGGVVAELLALEAPRRRLAARMTGLDVRYDLGDGHPLLGRRMPDLELGTAGGATRTFSLLHEARPVLLDLGDSATRDAAAPWGDRVRRVTASYDGPWDLPDAGEVPPPTAVLVRPDGHVAWVGEGTSAGLADALSTWLGPPAAGQPRTSRRIRTTSG